MYKLIPVIAIALLFMASNSFALDKFLNYRNISPAQSTDEDIPVVPDDNFAIKQGYIYTNLLAANVAESVTVPTGAKYVIISATTNIWVKIGGAATVPAGDTTNDTGSELNPGARYLDTATSIGIIAEAVSKVSLMFYK